MGKFFLYVFVILEFFDDVDNLLWVVYGNEGVFGDIDCFGCRFGCVVMDGFGLIEGGVVIMWIFDILVGVLGLLLGGI